MTPSFFMKLFKPSLQNRFFISLISLVFVAASIIAAVTVYQYRDESERYQRNQLDRVVKSIESSIDYQIENTTYPLDTKYIDLIFKDKIYEISHIHDTRIKLYDLDGKLLKSSRATFLNQSDSTQLSNRVLKRLKNSAENRFSYEHTDDEGHKIQSAFSYITDSHFKPLAILSIPHIESDGFLEKELRYFLIVLGQVYLILILAAVILSYLFSRYITKSLETVSEKIFTTRVDRKNQKIDTSKIPKEIQGLVEAYNAMVDELEESANKLAASEREQAWREMAKQVAHEVKNPLTPMRLSIQSFERNFDPDDPHNTEKIKSFSKTMIEQIDTMSAVASAFSNFAKMPKPRNEILNMVNVVQRALTVFNKEYIHFSTTKEEIFIQFDRTQLIRVITNLIKNAIQASENQSQPQIEVNLKDTPKNALLEVKDNGEGIRKEDKIHIFEPKFTTKTAGMGLGLGIIKQIIEFYHGRIRFESTEKEGTTFYITIPKNY